MKINFEDIKVGDHVTARLLVVDVDLDDPQKTIKVSPLRHDNWLWNSSIETHEPRALAIGDIVRFKGETHKFKLIGIDEDAAWIKSIPTGTWMPSTMLSNLERAE